MTEPDLQKSDRGGGISQENPSPSLWYGGHAFNYIRATGMPTGDFVVVRPHGDNRHMEKCCSQCDASMECNPGQGCWCADLPNVFPVPDEATEGCLCRSCLMKRLEQQVRYPPIAE